MIQYHYSWHPNNNFICPCSPLVLSKCNIYDFRQPLRITQVIHLYVTSPQCFSIWLYVKLIHSHLLLRIQGNLLYYLGMDKREYIIYTYIYSHNSILQCNCPPLCKSTWFMAICLYFVVSNSSIIFYLLHENISSRSRLYNS